MAAGGATAGKRKGNWRRPNPIPEAVQFIILNLISSGDSDNRVSKIVRLKPHQWKRLAAESRAVLKAKDGTRLGTFGRLLERAEAERCGGLGNELRVAMKAMIRRGHPWWAKLAIHNYQTGLKDPDVATGRKLKHALLKLAERRDSEEREIRVRRVVMPPTPAPAPPTPTATDKANAPDAG